MAVNYVKFMRGTQALYNSLATKDQDTLYFVYDAVSDDHGKLYLGNKLISGSSSNPSGGISLSDIGDILFDNNLADGDFLVYDEAENKWVNKPLAQALNVPIMTGATENASGTSGLVPVPAAGDQLKFLRGDGTWATVTAELSLQDRADISELQAQVTTLIGTDTNKSVATIVTEKVAELLIADNPKADLDTLEEIAQWIQDHPDDAAAMNSNISVLQTKVANLEDLINGTEQVNGLEARVSSLETTMGTFTPVANKYVDVGSAISYLNNSVTEINDRLRWHELSEE